MRSAGAAIAWELARRHRWGAVALGGYVVWAVLFKLLIIGAGVTVRLDPPDGWAAAVVVPFAILMMYCLALFSFGFDGDFAARRSIYPARMFALPVTSAALAGWPMLYGTVTVAFVWLVTALLARWPWGIDLPFVWPALCAAAYLAWLQALTWMPYGRRGARMIVAVMWLPSVNVVATVAVHLQISEPVMVAFLAPQIPLAYLCARVAVARARRGEVPDWRRTFARGAGRAGTLPGGRDHLASPARAQRWFEWRRHGWALPVWVGILLPFELAVLLLPGNPLVFQTLVVVLLTPPFVAAFAAAGGRASDGPASASYGVSPFIATRPLSSAGLVGAKLAVALASTLAAWLLVALAIPAALTLSGSWPDVDGWARDLVDIAGAPRALVIALLGLAALLTATWKQLVQGLCIGLTGRARLVKASVMLRLSLLIVLLPLLEWLHDSDGALHLLWRVLPWALAVWVGCKLAAAAWVATRLQRDRLVGDGVLVGGAAGWLVVVLALYGVLGWLLDLPPSMPRTLFMLLAVLAVPLVRPAAAAVALAWNRHRGARQRAAAESPATRRHGKLVAAAVLLLIGAPALLALLESTSHALARRNNGVIAAALQGRDYLLYVPSTYDGSAPTPLVISLHGGASWPAAQMNTSGWNRLAEERGFIVAYPSGAGFPRAWRVTRPGPGIAADVGFIAQLIDTLQARYDIDPNRIYVDGLSNGGGMAFVLSCTLSDRIAAVGMVASAQFLPSSWCGDPRAMPMITFHGTADRLTPYNGGESWVAPARMPDIPTFVAWWARRNRCAAAPVESAPAPRVTRREYTGCAGDAGVVLFTIDGGGHTWPGGEPLPEWLVGTTSRGVDATGQMWAFFEQHPLPVE